MVEFRGLVLRAVREAGVRESQALEEGAAERRRGLLFIVILGSGLVKKLLWLIDLFIHSVNKYLLSTCCVPDMI